MPDARSASRPTDAAASAARAAASSAPSASAPLVVGVDVRPALFARTGFGRVVRETVASLGTRADVSLRLYGAAWKRARPDCALPDVVAPRLPARLAQRLAPLGFGVETLLGPLDVFHHTDVVFAPVRCAREVLTIYDLVFLAGRNFLPPDFARAILARVTARAAAASAVVVPCAQVADAVVARGLAPASRVHVSALGCDHVDPRPAADDAARVDGVLRRCGLAPLRPDERLLLVPGTREPRKNQLAVVDAMASLPRDTRLVLAGPRGWGVPELEARLAREPRIAAPGEVDEADLAALLRRADVVAYPSLMEGFGLPVAEAMRCGRAVLTSLGTPMAAFGGDAVLAVDAEDRAAVAAGLLRLLREPALRADLGRAAAARVASLTWAAHTARLVDVYRAAVS